MDFYLTEIEKNNIEIIEGVPQVVWCYWEGEEMSGNRLLSFELLKKNIGVPVILVTPDVFKQLIKKDHPLPYAFKYLSIVHRSDYVRAYLMHYYGGGWHDIKATETSFEYIWKEFSNPDIWLIGRPETQNGGARVKDLEGKFMPDFYRDLVAVPAWIARPQTPLTKEILKGIEDFIDEKSGLLQKYPAKHPREKYIATKHIIAKIWIYLKKKVEGRNPFYPIPWTLFGNFFHPSILKYKSNISRNLPVDEVKNAGVNHRG